MWTSIALIVGALISGVVTRSIVVDLKVCNSEFNGDIMQNVSVSLVTVGNRKVLNGSLIPKIDVSSFDVTTIVKVLQGKTRKVTCVNLTSNGCELIGKPFPTTISLGSFIGSYIRNSIRNLPNKCPIKKFTEVVVLNLYGDTDLMPFPITPKSFEFTTTLTIETTMAFRIHVEGVVAVRRKQNG